MATLGLAPRGLLAVALIACTGFAVAGCGSSGSSDAGTTTAPARQAAGDSPLKTVATVAFGIYGKVNACLENRKVGRPCTSGDGGNIRATLKEVKELRSAVDANHAQALAEFDRIAALVVGSERNAIERELRTMSTNTELAMRAYQALMECSIATGTTCRPYIGGKDLRPAEPAKTAIEDTEAYLQRKLAQLPDVPVTASWFTGDRAGKFGNGLATAIWKFNKQENDQRAGVTDTAVKKSTTVPVVTHDLAQAQNQDITYWNNLFNEFGFLSVVKAGTKPGAAQADREREARSVQAEVDSAIAGTDRSDVYGSALHYSLPALPKGGLAIYDDGKAWVLAVSAAGGGRPAVADDIRAVAKAANSYASVEKLASAMPKDRWYAVKQPIIRREYSEFGEGCTFKRCPEIVRLRDLKVAELAGPGAAESCTVRMRPMNAQPTWPSYARNYTSGVTNPGEKIVSLEKVWKEHGQGPVDWNWALERFPTNNNFSAGWGAWVACGSISPSVRIDLVKNPALMGPAK